MVMPYRKSGIEPHAPLLMEVASAATGLEDFGDGRFMAALEALTHSLRHDAWPRMSPAARRLACDTLVRHLANRLKVVADRAHHPSIRQVEIRNPFIVIGPPRSGSTLLHTLLSQDPDNIGVPHWVCSEPSPPPALGEPTPERLAAAEATLRAYMEQIPGIRVQHAYFVEEGASALGECGSEILVMACTTKTYWYYYPVDGYLDYLLSADHGAALTFHRAFLQHLQWGRADRRWALKAADHLVWLRALHRTYPDANFLWTHRDLAEMFGSVASVFCTCRGMSGPVPTEARCGMGQQALALERRIFAHGMAARAELGEDRFHDVSYHDLMADPVGTMQGIYARFGLRLSSAASENIRAWVAHNPPTRHGTHRYAPEDFGFDARTINRQFTDYVERFGFGYGIRPH